MNTVDDLLRRALGCLDWEKYPSTVQAIEDYLVAPKEEIEELRKENYLLAAGQCTEGGPWGDEGGTQYCKYAPKKPLKPMTEEKLDKLLDDPRFLPDVKRFFIAGVRFAERHHGITG